MKAILYVFGCPINDDTICYFLFYEITEEKATLNSKGIILHLGYHTFLVTQE